jgi:hypothetical protein
LPIAVVETQLAEWRRLLRQSTTQSRAVLQRVIAGRILFTPTDDGGYRFEATTRYDKLFSGVAYPLPSWIPLGDASGTERIRPEETLDCDYGRLLERAQNRAGNWNVKGVASLTGFVALWYADLTGRIHRRV